MEHKRLLEILGSRLKALRLSRGWTQGEVATKARVTRDFLGRFERGDREPSLYVVLKLATVFDVAPAYLLTPPSDADREALSEVAALLSPRTDQEIRWFRDLIAHVLAHPVPGAPKGGRELPGKYGRRGGGTGRGK